jgi:peptidoglycan/xylan/chitin deacetylase (PgdA/CDA1 family)
VALTFDGDWFATGAEAIVGTLARHHARATFFLTGHFCHTFPAVCRALSAAGMELGNHSERHPDFTRQSDARIRTELERGEEALVQTFGHGARPLFRFPYSACDARSEALVARAGFQSIDCSLDVLDTVGRPKTSDFIAHRVMNQVRAGDVVLLHFTAGTAGALPRICNYLDHAGLQLVPVSTLLFSGARPTR